MESSIVVFHLNRELAIANGLAAPASDAMCGFSKSIMRAAELCWEARCYVPVAIVVMSKPMTQFDMAEALDSAYRETNTVETHWWWARNPKFLKIVGTHHRSTSVGDILQVIDNHTRRFYLVANLGFLALSEWETIKAV